MIRRLSTMLCLLAALAPLSTHAAAIQLPRTGQTLCYDSAGAVIACAATGQDGDTVKGRAWPIPRFTDNGNGTVSDNLTGLIWLKDANCFGGPDWLTALDNAATLASGGCGLSDGSMAGDWRLPNILELQSLVDLSRKSPALPSGHPFNNVQVPGYWTSTSYVIDPIHAVFVYMDAGDFDYNGKMFEGPAVWPVRGTTAQLPKTGQSGCWDDYGDPVDCATDPLAKGQDGKLQQGVAWPAPRFTDTGNGTLTDSLTGLIWLKDANCLGADTWSDALVGANGLASGRCGLDDGSVAGSWRLPNRTEMLSLASYQEPDGAVWLNSLGFSNARDDRYWSSDSFQPKPSKKWLSDPQGSTYGMASGNAMYVLPVRDPLNPVIGISPANKEFGSVTIKTPSSAQVVIIGNTGTAALTVTSIATTGGDSGQFGIAPGDGTGGTCGSLTPTIAAGATCTVSITFTPASIGAKTTTLRLSSNDPLTPAKDAVLTGTGAPLPTYTIIATVAGGQGAVVCDSPVERGATSVCTITPGTGYHLAIFADAANGPGSVVSLTYTITNVQADHAIIATFAIDTFTVNFVSGGNGTLSGAISQMVGYGGSTEPVTAVPAAGYHFVNWTGTGGFVTTSDNPLIEANVGADKVITAHFTADPVNGTCGAASGGTFAAVPSEDLCVAGTASAVSGSGLLYWSCSGLSGGTSAICSATIKKYNITFASSGNGSLAGATRQAVYHGGSTEPVTAVPATSYHFVNWTGTGGFVTTSDNPLIEANVGADKSITAHFIADSVAIDGTCGGSSGASFSIAPSEDLCATGTASAVTGSGPWGWVCSGLSGGTSAICSAGIQAYSVVPSVGAGGSVSPATPQTAYHGATVVFTIAPEGDNQISSVSGCQGTLSGTTYTTGPIAGSCTVTVSYTGPAHSGIIIPAAGKASPDIGDALKSFQFIVGVTTLTPAQLFAADVAPLGPDHKPVGNGTVDVGDVVLILRRVVGAITW